MSKRAGLRRPGNAEGEAFAAAPAPSGAPAAGAVEDALPYFLVSYELGPDWSAEAYKELYGVLRSFRSWMWLLDSLSIVQASSADLVHTTVSPLFNAADRFLVMEVPKPSGSFGAGMLHPLASSRRGRALAEPLHD